MSGNDKKTSTSKYEGLHRAMPIILVALALFIELCFFLDDKMGIFGSAISGVMLGLFSFGAYLIPILIVIHAIFYREDVEKRRILSRAFFSIVLLLIFSSAICTFTHLNGNIDFDPVKSYTDGQARTDGGFVGNVISFAIIKVFGVGGYFIIAAAIIAIYTTYLVARDNVNVRKLFYTTLSVIAGFFAKIEQKFKKLKESRAKAREKRDLRREEKRLRREEKNRILDDKRRHDLYCDDYFEVNNGMQELSIDELGIDERRSRVSEEMNPNLSNSVRHKSAVAKDSTIISDGYDSEVYFSDDTVTVRMSERSGRTERKLDLDYDIDDLKTYTYTEQKQTQRSAAQSGFDDSAESVFTKDFDPFDFDASEKFASKPSSRAAEAPHSTRINDGDLFNTGIGNITEEDIARARRLADFEERKKRVIEHDRATRQQQAQQSQPTVASEPAPQHVKEESVYTPPMRETPVYTPPVKEEPVYTTPVSQTSVYTPPVKEEPVYSKPFAATADDSFVKVEQADESENFQTYTPTVPEEDEFIFSEPIPESEQSQVVLDQRRMFTIFNEPSFVKEEIYAQETFDMPDVSVSDYTEEDDVGFVNEAKAPAIDIAALENDSSSYEADLPPFDFDEEDPFARGKAKVEEKPIPERKAAPVSNKPDYSNYQLPSLDLLAKEDNGLGEQTNAEATEKAMKLIETLASFNVTASIRGFDRGPRITRYEVVPASGVKVSSIMNLFDDIALNLAAEGIRMEAPIPGKSAVGVEIPNSKPYTVRLRSLLETEEFASTKSKTAVCVGKDVAGQPVFGDISKMPHMLIAGATGMGKSVCINSLLISMLYKARPDEVKFIMIDPKKVEFNIYNGIPHLLIPVVTDPKQAAGALMWAVEQMEKRYDLIEQARVRNIEAYNAKVLENPGMGEPLPKIVIVVDELADLMLQVKNPVEGLIMSIAQKARAAGIHLIIGTQRPSVDIITGVIKANIPTRISCKVMSNADSRTVLDIAGAEKLLDKGDMLFNPAGAPKPKRVQGAFVSDSEVESIIEFIKSQAKGNVYDDQALEEINRAAQKCSKEKNSGGRGGYDDDGDSGDDGGLYNNQEFLDAVDVAVTSGKISTSLLQRKLSIGFGKAAKFIDGMEDLGIVGGPNGQKPREVLITKDEWHEKLSRISLD